MSGAEEEQQPEEVEQDSGLADEVERSLRAWNRRNRRGHFSISYDLIQRLLSLPETMAITGIHSDPRVHGIIISVVDDTLPEIPENVESQMINVMGSLRLIAAPPVGAVEEPDEPPADGAVLYAHLDFSLPTPTEQEQTS